MSLDYVRAGEPVRSSTINSLIGAVAGGGNQSPDLMVTGTPRGPQLAKQAETGSVDLPWGSVFDVRNYTLSGWPMAKIRLGFSLGDALGAVRIHGEDGVDNPVSALVVTQNSANCPVAGGLLSTVALQESDFAKDAAQGAAGWVKTGMEGVYGATEPRLEVWRTTGAAYEVFTNAAESSVAGQVSAAVAASAGDQVSSLQKVDGWKLVGQGRLQGRPTSRVVMKNGVVDIWNAGRTGPARAMLKAFLGCYAPTSGGGGRTTSWTWLVPLGSDAQYDDEHEGAWTTQCSYGGDPIFIECGSGAPGDGWDGSATWLEDSNWGTRLVAFGKFESEPDGLVQPGELWMDLSYDYQAWAVKGTLNGGQSSPRQDEAVLLTSVKIAECASYKAKAEAGPGDEAPGSDVFQGTLGDLFAGTPKLDAYTPVQNGAAFSSLNWAKRGVDGEGANQGPVTCRCLQIKDFDSAEGVSAETSSDMWLVRRYDGQTSSASLVYVPVSTGEATPDSSLSGAQTSSLQWRTEGETSSKALQIWNFDAVGDAIGELGQALSCENHVMLRNRQTSSVQYLQLSALSSSAAAPSCDSQYSGQRPSQKSLQWREIESGGEDYLQLYGFHDGPSSGDRLSVKLTEQPKPLLGGNSQFLVRTIGRDGSRTLEYKSLSAAASGGGGTSFPGPFEMALEGTAATFTNCVMRVARAYFFYNDMTCVVPTGDQMVFSVLQHSATPSVTVSAAPYADVAAKLGTDWSNLLSTTVTPLYRVTGGDVACDYRYMMNVQAYDSRNYSYAAG